MKALMIFTFAVLVYFVSNTFHAKTNASVYEIGVKALLERSNTGYIEHGGKSGSFKRGPAVLPRTIKE